MKVQPWKIFMDTGGTFTDCLAINPAGETIRMKVLSSGALRTRVIRKISARSFEVEPIAYPDDNFHGFEIRLFSKPIDCYKIQQIDFSKNIIHVDREVGKMDAGCFAEISSGEEVPVFITRLLTGTSLTDQFPEIELKLGSTKGTNALLERKGSRTAFLVTKGFKDLLRIGDQQRPDLFALDVRKPDVLYDHVIEVDERIGSEGEVIVSLTATEKNRILKILKQKKIETVAVALLNSYRNPSHEEALYSMLAKHGMNFISISTRLSSQVKILPRAQTAVVNAYLDPIISKYLDNIQSKLKSQKFHIMSSAGGLLPVNSFFPKDSLLSGPAGGIAGALSVAIQSGQPKIVTFDMGGTSTDVSLCNGRPDYRYDCIVADQKILSPSLSIDTIAAGGGSVCDFDGHRFTVGPQSAGAFPGPACYGAGGPLTITDVNLLLGRLDEENFAVPLRLDKAEDALAELIHRIQKRTKKKYNKETVLQSFLQIANEKMAEAIRKISIRKGFDLREYALLGFGGAGGQHVCNLAAMLGMDKILVPYDAGLLSAYGIGNAQVEHVEEQLVLKPVEEVSLTDEFSALRQKVEKKLMEDGYSASSIHIGNKFVFLRIEKQESSLEIEVQDGMDVLIEFQKQYTKIYGYWLPENKIEVEYVRMIAGIKERQRISVQTLSSADSRPVKVKKIVDQGDWKNCEVFRWEELGAGFTVRGPALIISQNATLFVEQSWELVLDKFNTAHLHQAVKKLKKESRQTAEATLELFTNRFTAIAQDMGAMLQRTAFSVNVKERLDFSCALLDSNGNLVVNAPHIPVHLGSLGVCVRAVKKKIKMKEGDVVITNHPAYGGSHLPDITLIKPVFHAGKCIAYVANRAHHAELGGKKPGSMPADATRLIEEGVILSPTYLVKSGKPQWDHIKKELMNARYPTRALQENLADLQAALASLIRGEQGLRELVDTHGVTETLRYMRKLKQYSASLMNEVIQSLKGREFRAAEFLDDGSKLRVKISVSREKMTIDFTGSASQHPGNLNATPAIVNSVILYVLRLLINKPVPMNEGIMDNVQVILPSGLLNPVFKSDPEQNPAVVGGNTEVSQRLTDTLLKAFNLSACSQGTMNNFLFGNERFGYYETICGGTGAGNGFHGADAVHQHMTNTKITDPEILEWRYPVRLERFEVRKNSGGSGKWNGGDGVIREFYVKDTLEVNILSQHREEVPFGMKGGHPGKPGRQYVIRANGKKEKLKSVDGTKVFAGERLVIETPGGGGWGKL